MEPEASACPPVTTSPESLEVVACEPLRLLESDADDAQSDAVSNDVIRVDKKKNKDRRKPKALTGKKAKNLSGCMSTDKTAEAMSHGTFLGTYEAARLNWVLGHLSFPFG